MLHLKLFAQVAHPLQPDTSFSSIHHNFLFIWFFHLHLIYRFPFFCLNVELFSVKIHTDDTFLRWIDLGWAPGDHQSHSLIPFLSCTEERKYYVRFMGWNKGRERFLAKYHHGQNQLDLGKSVLFVTNQIIVEKRETNPKLKTLFCHPYLFPRLIFTPKFSSSLPWGVLEDKEWGLW